MTVKFMGYKSGRRSGCPACGSRTTSNYTVERNKKIIMPSGRIEMFWAGQNYDVHEKEGQFLLSLSDDSGKPMFTEVV